MLMMMIMIIIIIIMKMLLCVYCVIPGWSDWRDHPTPPRKNEERPARKEYQQKLVEEAASVMGLRKGTNGVSTTGVTANFIFFDRGTFWVLPLTYFCIPKSAGV